MIRNIASLIVSGLLIASVAQAENARVVVPIDGEVDNALGLIISPEGTKQVKVDAPTKRDEQSVIVEIPFSNGDKKAGALATALVTLKSGSIALGDLVSLQQDYPDNSFSDLPLCQDSKKLPPLMESQLGNLKRLVEIRSERRAVLQTKLARLMQGKQLENLRGLERGFGTDNGVPLSPALLPYELIDRLSRLKHAISNYQANRTQAKKQ